MLNTNEIKEYIDTLNKKDNITPRGLFWRKYLENELTARNILNL